MSQSAKDRAAVMDAKPVAPQAFGTKQTVPKVEPQTVDIAGIKARATALDANNESIMEDAAKKLQIEEALRQQKVVDDVKVAQEHVDVSERLKIQRMIPLFRMNAEAIATSSDKHVIAQHLSQMLKLLPDHVTQMSKEDRQNISNMVTGLAPALHGDRELMAKHTALMNMLHFEKKPKDTAAPKVTFGLPPDFLDLDPPALQKKYKFKLADLRKHAYNFGVRARSTASLIAKLQKHMKGLASESKGEEVENPGAGGPPPFSPPPKAQKRPRKGRTPKGEAKGKGMAKPGAVTAPTTTEGLIKFLLAHAK